MIRYEWKAGDPIPDAWPDWMKAARIERCTIEVEDSGWVVWHGGVWHGGVWLGGVWHGGVWHGGVWLGGEWHGGVWLGGVWHGGEWLGGESKPRCRWSIYGHGDLITIGCKKKTIAEWDAFFAGTETYDTPRDSEAFRLIRANYLAQRAWQLALSEK